MRILVIIFAVAMMTGQGARADWRGFYTPSEPVGQDRRSAVSEAGICVHEVLRAQLRHSIPGNLLLAIGLQEAGMMQGGELTIWPWVANANGDGRYFDSRAGVESWVMSRLQDGEKSIDLGCMQINLRWHPDAFDSITEGFDPARNVDYAARLLVSLYRETGDWAVAAGRYHSGTPALQKAYLTRLKSNVAIANARLDTFRALAATGAGRAAAAPRTPLPDGHFWTAWLTQRSRAEDDGARSLYGRQTLEAVLPNHRKMF